MLMKNMTMITLKTTSIMEKGMTMTFREAEGAMKEVAVSKMSSLLRSATDMLCADYD